MGMTNSSISGRIGVYVDAANLYRNGGNRMNYGVLREFACRGNSDPVRLNVYVSYDEERAQNDLDYSARQEGFYSVLRNFGYKVIQKRVTRFKEEDGTVSSKSNADLDLAVDASCSPGN